MRKFVLMVAALALAAGAGADTVVLKGGKRLEVQRYVQQGNYVVVEYSAGRLESYPLSAVDLAATAAANAKPAPATPVPTPAGPHSPFFAARAAGGSAAVTVTDADVKHVEEEPAQEASGEEASKSPGGVVLVGYEKKEVEPGTWDVTATVANRSANKVRGVTAAVKLADKDGQVVGTGAAGYPGELEPGQQGALTARIEASGEPTQVSFDLQWQEITPAPAAEPAPGVAKGPNPAPAAHGSGGPPQYEVPPGASPNAVPSNPMARPPLTRPPGEAAPQVARPTPPPA